jgi:hypothetical protein
VGGKDGFEALHNNYLVNSRTQIQLVPLRGDRISKKVKLFNYRPEKALNAPGGWGSPNFHTIGRQK